uniref:Uncharacterized protein n=1 Tax=Aegilops tauschii subsp. strangulata TaxID=200361 RepID=A0A453I5M8_AEGTS
RQMARRSGLLAKQVISVSSARSLGFVSQLWVDASSVRAPPPGTYFRLAKLGQFISGDCKLRFTSSCLFVTVVVPAFYMSGTISYHDNAFLGYLSTIITTNKI